MKTYIATVTTKKNIAFQYAFNVIDEQNLYNALIEQNKNVLRLDIVDISYEQLNIALEAGKLYYVNGEYRDIMKLVSFRGDKAIMCSYNTFGYGKIKKHLVDINLLESTAL
jgi:hypothetical protein